MSDRAPFTAAVALLTQAGPTDDLCAPFISAISVTGAAISTLGDPLGSQTICASDAVSARLDEIQLDLGEGPCWHCLRTRTPVLLPDLHRFASDLWPAARDDLRSLPAGGLFAFPLFVGSIDVGSVDLYTITPHTLSAQQIEDTASLANIAARQVLRRALSNVGDDESGLPATAHSRREIHQASGMIAAQMTINVADALLLLRAHAFGEGRTAMQIAEDVISRKLTFTDQP